MKSSNYLYSIYLFTLILSSCSIEDNDDNLSKRLIELPGEAPGDSMLQIMDFEWKAMNIWYYYKEDKPILQNDYFSTQSELNEWLQPWTSPEELFYNGLLFNYPSEDRFSWIVDDYNTLENEFSGIIESSGMDFSLFKICSECQEVAGIVRYIVPNSPADIAGVKRGMIFTQVDQIVLTVQNYKSLLYTNLNLTYGFNDISENNIGNITQEIAITKTVLNENPIHIKKIIEFNGIKVGYLMYNSFIHDYDDELNEAFAFFKSQGVVDLILDLRYNSGGRLTSAIDLGSMINGKLNNEIFFRKQYNRELTNHYNELYGSESLVSRFDNRIYEYDNNHSNHQPETINSLDLNKVYIIATGSTYSAGEVLINGLSPYMEVIHIGSTTGGKFQASVTLYDSDAPYFRKDSGNLNTDHTYALQPIISSNTNANNEAYPDGLIPDIEIEESLFNYGVLGEIEEPLLRTALNYIAGWRSVSSDNNKAENYQWISESDENSSTYKKMYMEGLLE